MLRMRLSSNRQARLLQLFDPIWCLAFRHVTPLVEFLAQDFQYTKNGQEKSSEWASQVAEYSHSGDTKRYAQFVHVVFKSSFGDCPCCIVRKWNEGQRSVDFQLQPACYHHNITIPVHNLRAL